MRCLIPCTLAVLALTSLGAIAQTTLTWDPVPAVDEYVVCYSPTGPDQHTVCASTGSTLWTHTTGISGVEYQYVVAARRRSGDEWLQGPNSLPVSKAYEGTTWPTPPPPPPPPDPILPPPSSFEPSPLPTLLPPGDRFVDCFKEIWTWDAPQGTVRHNGAYLTNGDQLNLRPLGTGCVVTMRQNMQWWAWDREAATWRPTAEEAGEMAAPTEVCGDGLDNDRDGQIDEVDAGCIVPPAPVECVVSAWSDWSAWSAWTPVNGLEEQRTRTRTRTVTTPAQNGGGCVPLSEMETERRTSDVCTTMPLRINNVSWPNPATGSRRFGYTSSQPIASFTVTLGATSTRNAVFTDTRGCIATVR